MNTITKDSKERKETPIFTGCINYFPLALAAVANLSRIGNEKHNPGEPMHWNREVSKDHLDCIARHMIDSGKIDYSDGILHDVKIAWRALANLQEKMEESSTINKN